MFRFIQHVAEGHRETFVFSQIAEEFVSPIHLRGAGEEVRQGQFQIQSVFPQELCGSNSKSSEPEIVTVPVDKPRTISLSSQRSISACWNNSPEKGQNSEACKLVFGVYHVYMELRV